ncbi:hypothetical protein EVAR_27712_1 [Eumeta japonica]|uniref:Uncharacterized protein n=1 Tax=Eumeta variegata TaxID=151549 RepID=A0A4C1WR27_EUMVA|nr:hypothetical protein EVAR_27712_1 [Eumeta japonica]
MNYVRFTYSTVKYVCVWLPLIFTENFGLLVYNNKYGHCTSTGGRNGLGGQGGARSGCHCRRRAPAAAPPAPRARPDTK